jgi:nitrogen PTS system EIIA component
MKHILNALKEGRLIELPCDNKPKALEYLAVILEANPDIEIKSDIVQAILDHEQTSNTGIGMGVAVPRNRTKNDGELICTIGWSAKGIEYDAEDGHKVHLLVMFYVPDSQRNIYLKEISMLAKEVKEAGGIEKIKKLKDLQDVRNLLLDWIEKSMEKASSFSKARMIKLETKKSEIETAKLTELEGTLNRLNLIPFTLLVLDDKNIILSSNQSFVETAENAPELSKIILENTKFEWNGYSIWVNSSKIFSMNRSLYECVAVK